MVLTYGGYIIFLENIVNGKVVVGIRKLYFVGRIFIYFGGIMLYIVV